MSPVQGRPRRTKKPVPGVVREDSDDELGVEDHPWEWIYDGSTPPTPSAREPPAPSVSPPRDADGEAPSTNGAGGANGGGGGPGTVLRKRKRKAERRIVGARMGKFECRLGDTVMLKADGSNEAWVGIICEFVDDDGDEGEKAANFMWFSTETEIRNKEKKRNDFYWNELYVSPSWDINPLAAINGKATVMSLAAFLRKYPSGKVPRNSRAFGKVFVCRRGCNTRTASYTEDFVWEDIYHGTEDDVLNLCERVKRETKATRRLRRTGGGAAAASQASKGSPDLYAFQDSDAEEGVPKVHRQTPKKQRTMSGATTPSKRRATSKPTTPSSHRKIMVKKHLEFTPLATRTLSPSHYQGSPFQLARARLHVASVPTSLPCREEEFGEVYSHLEAAITEGTGTCIYISGTPGTGKTATVREVVASLDRAVRADELDDFIFVEINGMKVTDPHQAYSLLWEALKGQRVSPSQALDLLEREFGNPSPRRVPCVVLMDELDQLVTKNQGVMYNFFNWPGLRHSRLIVLAVANTMDLPERTLSNKISSRLGLTRITFPGYNHEQLMRIVQSRLEGVPGDVVEPDAVQFASRKVAAVSGDARRALDICRRAVEIAEAESRALSAADDGAAGAASEPSTPSKKPSRRNQRTTKEDPAQQQQQQPQPKKRSTAGRVTIDTVRRAIAEATTSPLQQYLRALPFAARLLLAALLLRTGRTGLAESTYGDVLEEMQRAVRFGAGLSRQVELLELVGAEQNAGAQPPSNSSNNKTAAGAGDSWMHRLADPNNSGKPRRDPRAAPSRLAGLGRAAVELTGAGIVNLEAHRAERPSKIRLAVGDEEVRLAFRDDPEIKALGLVL